MNTNTDLKTPVNVRPNGNGLDSIIDKIDESLKKEETRAETRMSLLDRLTTPPAIDIKKAEGSLIVRATERALNKYSRQLRSWHKACVRDAALIAAASGNAEEAQNLALS